MMISGDLAADPVPQKKTARSQAGFTLLEVMASVAIIAIVLVAVYHLHAQTLSMSSAVRFYALAPALIEQKMTEWSTSKDAALESGDFGSDFPGFEWRIAVEDVSSETLDKYSENLKKIQMTISLNNGEHTYSLHTYRFVPEKR